MFERFSRQSRRVIVRAQEEARLLDHNYIGTEHLLLGLLHNDTSTAATALTSSGVTLEAARAEVESIIGLGTQAPTGHIPFTARAKKCLELSLREALQLGDNYIGTGHLLLGLLRTGDGVGTQVLERLGADLGQLRDRVTAKLQNDPEAGEAPDEPALPRPSRPQPIRRLLDTIENRLTSIENYLGIPRAEPAAGPAGGAAESGAGGAAESGSGGAAEPGAAGAGGAAPAAGEIGRLNAEVTRLKALLREHDIDPGEGGGPGTATG